MPISRRIIELDHVSGKGFRYLAIPDIRMQTLVPKSQGSRYYDPAVSLQMNTAFIRSHSILIQEPYPSKYHGIDEHSGIDLFTCFHSRSCCGRFRGKNYPVSSNSTNHKSQ
jgi:hypothetical protein